jgi:hypothetical protein
LATLARNSHGRLALGSWTIRHENDTESYLRSLGMPSVLAQSIASEAPMTMITLVGGGNLVGVVGVGGSASCMTIHVFQSHNGGLVALVNPGIARGMLCMRWGSGVSLGSVDGILVLAVEQPNPTNNSTTIELAPWTGRGWDANCGVVVSYVPELVSENAFCGLANCSAALRTAKRIAAEAGVFGNRVPPVAQDPDDSELQRLLTLADDTAGMNILPASAGSQGGDFLRSPQWVLTRMEKRPTLVVLGDWQSDPAVDSESIGMLVGLWQATGDKLSPVAGFHLRVSMAVVRSVYVTR